MSIPFARQTSFYSETLARNWCYRDTDIPLKPFGFAGTASTRLFHSGFLFGTVDPEHQEITEHTMGKAGGGAEHITQCFGDDIGPQPCGVNAGFASSTSPPIDPNPPDVLPEQLDLWTTYPFEIIFLGSTTTIWYGWSTETIVEQSSAGWVKLHQDYDFTPTITYTIEGETETWNLASFGDRITDYNAGAPTYEKLKVMDRVTWLKMTVKITGVPNEVPGSECDSSSTRIITFEYGSQGAGSGEDSILCPAGYAPFLRVKGSAQLFSGTCYSIMGVPAFASFGATGVEWEENDDFTDAYGTKHRLLSATLGRVEATSGTTAIADPSTFYGYSYCDQNAAASLTLQNKHSNTIKIQGNINAFGEDLPAADLPYQIDLPFNFTSTTQPTTADGLSDGSFFYEHSWPRWSISDHWDAWGFRYVIDGPGFAVAGAHSTDQTEIESGTVDTSELGVKCNINSWWLCRKGWDCNHQRAMFHTSTNYDILQIEHSQRLALTGTWTGNGDMTKASGRWSTPSGTGFLTLSFDTPFDCEGYRFMNIDMTTYVDANQSVDMWSNKEPFNTHTGHTGKRWSITGSSNIGEMRTVEIDLCSPQNPTRNADEYPDWPYDAWAPGGTPKPGRDPQVSRYPRSVEKKCIVSLPGVVPDTMGNLYAWRGETDGPTWGIGGPGLKELRIEGFAAGEQYEFSIPQLFVKSTDTIDMISSYETNRFKPTSEDTGTFAEALTDFCFTQFTGFKGSADGKQSMEVPTIVSAPHFSWDSAVYSSPFEDVTLQVEGADDDTAPKLNSITINDLSALINKRNGWHASVIATGHVFNNADRPASLLFGGSSKDAMNIDLSDGLRHTCWARLQYDEIYRDDENYDLNFEVMLGAGFQGVVLSPETYEANPSSGADIYYFQKYAPQQFPLHSSVPVEIDNLELWGSGDTDSNGTFKTGLPYRWRGPQDNHFWSSVQPTIYCESESRPDISAAHDPSAEDSATPPGLSVAIIDPAAILDYPILTFPEDLNDGQEQIGYAMRSRWRVGLYATFVENKSTKQFVSVIKRGYVGHGRLLVSDGNAIKTQDHFDVAPFAKEAAPAALGNGIASCGFKDPDGRFHHFYARSFAGSSGIFYRIDSNAGPGPETKLMNGNYPSIAYSLMGEIVMIFIDGTPTHAYSIVLKPAEGFSDPAFYADLSTRFDLGAADASGTAIEQLPNGVFQCWFSVASVLHTYISVNGGRSWTSVW